MAVAAATTSYSTRRTARIGYQTMAEFTVTAAAVEQLDWTTSTRSWSCWPEVPR